ncbi:MAG: glycoside hydrolase 43 family protein [Chitinophagaceae bacterium]
MKFLFLLITIFFTQLSQSQTSRVWRPDNGNGTYKNPIIHADYSDPDAIRVGDDYYMIASSFNAAPGLPLLHSKDLVNWKLIGYALQRQPPYDHFSKPQHGNGVWAPSIRYHKGEFYIYYPDPDFGIYLTKSKNINGPWSDPVLVQAGKGLIDPCPLWDDNGDVYLVHAFAGSRAGIKSIIVIKKLNATGTQVIDEGVMVYDGHDIDPTIEGPKFHKRNGYYYIFAPAGGVSTGWQLVLRSKNVYGPYERKIVMDQGSSPVNGPHQGAWVNTPGGEDWFIHFQDKDAYGRVVHLQPMQWKNDWPVIGVDKDNDGKGEPVLTYKKPNVGKVFPAINPPESDEFNESRLGLQWQWHANPKSTWVYPYPSKGVLRVFSDKIPESFKTLWDVPNLLLQKFPAETFTATMKFSFLPRLEGEQFGLVVMGASYAYISLQKKADGIYLVQGVCAAADKGNAETSKVLQKITDSIVYFRVKVQPGTVCNFEYGTDAKNFTPVGEPFIAKPGRWIGAKTGFFCIRNASTNDAGFADIDWFRIN